MGYLVIAMIIVAIICFTVVKIVKIGTEYCERMEKIKHGYPIDGVEPVNMKTEEDDYHKVEYTKQEN